MGDTNQVFLHVWNGDHQTARCFVQTRYPDSSIVEISHQELRSRGWRGQLRALRGLKGKALAVFFESLNDTPQLQLVLWSGLIHRCRETMLADGQGNCRVVRRKDLFRLAPRTAFSVVCDILVLTAVRLLLAIWTPVAPPRNSIGTNVDLDVAYLFPYPLVRDIAGGAMSHIRGVLGGLRAAGASCEIFSAVPVPVEAFKLLRIQTRRRFFIFWESLMLTYGFRFALEVKKALRGRRVGALYQRHGRFTIAGAVLSRLSGIPLILEYNGSEQWMAKYWDPTRFHSWMRLCEEVSLRCASLVVVVSDPIKAELLERGIPEERVVVSPNAVDPDYFKPGNGGEQLRKELGIQPGEIVVTFVGSFGPWHGVTVLRQAIAEILKDPSSPPIRFVLVGNGPLQQETRTALQEFEKAGKVIFTGMVTHDLVRPYLDAADILASPHVPLKDGKPFFGSPTKLFEYMSMGKAIVASNLDQLAEVLTHGETALLVEPENVNELIAAIQLLAVEPALRQRLGRAARRAAIDRHTWKQNVTPVLAFARQENGARSNQSGIQVAGQVTNSELS